MITLCAGTINSYRTPNFIFLGDDTTSASAVFSIKTVALIRAPLISMQSPHLLSWQGVSNQIYWVQTSENLIDWTTLGRVYSPSADYFFTNRPASLQQYFRVVFP